MFCFPNISQENRFTLAVAVVIAKSFEFNSTLFALSAATLIETCRHRAQRRHRVDMALVVWRKSIKLSAPHGNRGSNFQLRSRGSPFVS